MSEDAKNLLLSEVQKYNPQEFSRCRVHYARFAGKGKDWEYEAGGDPFEYVITPVQAVTLSKMQDTVGQRSSPQLEAIMVGIPSKLIGKNGNFVHITSSAQVAVYDLLIN